MSSDADGCSGVSSASSSKAAATALFANCLLPIAHVSSAVPMASAAATCYYSVVSLEEQLLLYRLHRRNFQHITFGEMLCLTDDDE
ncbi:unnamed protein product [Linum trigynum]